jgi:DNA-directed RNA polymerase specialized sigma24 family protein
VKSGQQFAAKGERMSGIVIAQLSASAETPGMPPFGASEHGLADTGEGLAASPTDFIPTDLLEAAPQTDLAEAEAIEVEPAQECPTPAADETAMSADARAQGGDRDLWLYRDRTVALLRRYMRLSIEVGRMPSLLGREFFRARVTAYKASTFEDSVIFVHDVERSLEELTEFEKKLIAKIVLQQYSKEEAGRLLGCGYRTVERLFPETLDRISEILLRRGILTGLPKAVPKTCQGGKTGPFLASD